MKQATPIRIRTSTCTCDRRVETTLISRASGAAGTKSDSESSEPAISNDGKLVAFTSSADDLVKEKASFVSIYLRDTGSGETVLVSRQSDAEGSAPPDSSSTDPTISTGARRCPRWRSTASPRTSRRASRRKGAGRTYARSKVGRRRSSRARTARRGRVVEAFGRALDRIAERLRSAPDRLHDLRPRGQCGSGSGLQQRVRPRRHQHEPALAPARGRSLAGGGGLLRARWRHGPRHLA